MRFHPEGVGRGTTPALNRERKRDRVRAGTAAIRDAREELTR
jgi:hypothetical protein